MKPSEIINTFNDAMSDMRRVYFTFDGQDRDRKTLAEGIMKMEKIMDPLGAILVPLRDKERQ